MNMSKPEIRAQLLDEAIKAGVIDTRPALMRSPVLRDCFEILERTEKEHSQNPAQFNLLEFPDALRYEESALSAGLHATIADYWCIELARIAVPYGSVGFLHGIDQGLNDASGSYFPSNSAYWGSPRFEFAEVDDCRWWFTLEPFYGSLPARFELSLTNPFDIGRLPGRPYQELHEVRSLWYPPGQDRTVRMIIPTQSLLRFYFYCEPQSVYQWRAYGRLQASIQSTFSSFAEWNSRRC